MRKKKKSQGISGVIITTLILLSVPVLSAGYEEVEHEPFFLYDYDGNEINPVTGLNADKPYSPRNSCGVTDCHDYDKITEGYHFQQGYDEMDGFVNEEKPWVTSPGMYGKW